MQEKHGHTVVFLNPKTCGMYKNGNVRYKVDAQGRRTKQVDNELLDHVDAFLEGTLPDGGKRVPAVTVQERDVLVPRYYDPRWDKPLDELIAQHGWQALSLGELQRQKVLLIRGGHGSPGNDQRVGTVPYIKVSDIRNLRINANPTNMVPRELATKLWRGSYSGLQPWDLLTPNRASSNIGEFAVLLPGEERIVLTKEVFILRVTGGRELGWDPFFLLWALSLRPVRLQWQRITLMQTNREDVGERYKDIRIPVPPSAEEAKRVSGPFRDYFTTIAESKHLFHERIQATNLAFVSTVLQDVFDKHAGEALAEEHPDSVDAPLRALADDEAEGDTGEIGQPLNSPLE